MSAGRFPRVNSRSPGGMANQSVGCCITRRRIPGNTITALVNVRASGLGLWEMGMRLSLVIMN
jgi:hypothetical protein